jgi:hypothetical protein
VKSHLQSRASSGLQSWYSDPETTFKTERPHPAGEGAEQQLQPKGCSYQLGKSIVLTTLHDHNLNLTGIQKNKTLATRESPGETMSELLLIWR